MASNQDLKWTVADDDIQTAYCEAFAQAVLAIRVALTAIQNNHGAGYALTFAEIRAAVDAAEAADQAIGEQRGTGDGGGYYVTARDGARTAYLRGPYHRHQEALAAVDEAMKAAFLRDPESVFYAFGTARVTAAPYPTAVLGTIAGEQRGTGA